MNINEQDIMFLKELEMLLTSRKQSAPEGSYTAALFAGGIDKILQKVGEEAVEYIIDAKNAHKERAIEEAADLVYHLMVSLIANGWSLADVVRELKKRHEK